MKSPFVSELEPNRVVTTSFLVHSKEIRQKKSGELYLSLLLADRTGELDAKMWDNVTESLEAFDRDDFVKVKGLIQIFHNRPQLTIHKVRRMDDSEIEFADYFPSSKRDPAEMWSELRGIVATFSNLHLKSLLDAMLGDPDIASRYRRAPAAKHIHHAFLGGLIEHVLSLCALAQLVAPHYPVVDRDLLLTGIVLHDIGKIYELSYERGFSYTNEGQLIGHIAIAQRMVGDKLRGLPGFPPRLRSLVEHLILSHHGRLEFGSPKVPQFPEALLLHYLDDLDSKMECMRALVQNDRQLDGCFTSYSASLERTVLKLDRYWAEDAPAPAVAPRPLRDPAEPAAAASRLAPPNPSTPSTSSAPPTPSAAESWDSPAPRASNGALQPRLSTEPAPRTATASSAPHDSNPRPASPASPPPHPAPALPGLAADSHPVPGPPLPSDSHHAPSPAHHTAPPAQRQSEQHQPEYRRPEQRNPEYRNPEQRQPEHRQPEQHSFFASKLESPFADKLRNALKPAPEREN